MKRPQKTPPVAKRTVPPWLEPFASYLLRADLVLPLNVAQRKLMKRGADWGGNQVTITVFDAAALAEAQRRTLDERHRERIAFAVLGAPENLVSYIESGDFSFEDEGHLGLLRVDRADPTPDPIVWWELGSEAHEFGRLRALARALDAARE